MKTPIEVNDIRKGDRVEQRFTHNGCETRRRGVVESVYERGNGETGVVLGGVPLLGSGDWYLLHRPVVDLPTKKALGTVAFADGAVKTGLCYVYQGAFYVDGMSHNARTPDEVIRWEPAEAVPTAALAILREQPPRSVPVHWYRNRTARFLAAVAAANGDRP